MFLPDQIPANPTVRTGQGAYARATTPRISLGFVLLAICVSGIFLLFAILNWTFSFGMVCGAVAAMLYLRPDSKRS